jgi:hypothetical protein
MDLSGIRRRGTLRVAATAAAATALVAVPLAAPAQAATKYVPCYFEVGYLNTDTGAWVPGQTAEQRTCLGKKYAFTGKSSTLTYSICWKLQPPARTKLQERKNGKWVNKKTSVNRDRSTSKACKKNGLKWQTEATVSVNRNTSKVREYRFFLPATPGIRKASWAFSVCTLTLGDQTTPCGGTPTPEPTPEPTPTETPATG